MMKIKVALFVTAMLATTPALARTAMPTEPYGTAAQQAQCVADMEASLHGQSPFADPRGTPEYFQDRGFLEGVVGMTEYDVMVGRCMRKFYHQYVRAHGGYVQSSWALESRTQHSRRRTSLRAQGRSRL